MSQFIRGEANKALVAILTTVAAALPVYFSDAKWLPVVVMALGAIATYLVPNTPPASGGTKAPSGM
jgi:uncharacterized membrane protein (UPF0136 family)